MSVLNELEIYVKALVLERMKEKGIAKPDMDPSDVDLNRDYTSELESRCVVRFRKLERFVIFCVKQMKYFYYFTSTSGSDSSVSDGLPMHVLYSRREKV